ncbi:MAG TPA: helix-turn-helix domain-containing protein [Candidatus Elarobacter sp.]|nr:helix-turn-helix domain-containing protein [Candidatus Elarobacter sp.]
MFGRGNPTGVSAAAPLSEDHEPDVPPLLLAAPFVVLHDQLLADAERLRELDPASSASVVYERIAARVSAAIRSAAHGETFVTTTEAATLLGVGRSAIVARIRRKQLAAVKRNHNWLIDRRTLEALL